MSRAEFLREEESWEKQIESIQFFHKTDQPRFISILKNIWKIFSAWDVLKLTWYKRQRDLKDFLDYYKEDFASLWIEIIQNNEKYEVKRVQNVKDNISYFSDTVNGVLWNWQLWRSDSRDDVLNQSKTKENLYKTYLKCDFWTQYNVVIDINTNKIGKVSLNEQEIILSMILLTKCFSDEGTEKSVVVQMMNTYWYNDYSLKKFDDYCCKYDEILPFIILNSKGNIKIKFQKLDEYTEERDDLWEWPKWWKESTILSEKDFSPKSLYRLYSCIIENLEKEKNKPLSIEAVLKQLSLANTTFSLYISALNKILNEQKQGYKFSLRWGCISKRYAGKKDKVSLVSSSPRKPPSSHKWHKRVNITEEKSYQFTQNIEERITKNAFWISVDFKEKTINWISLSDIQFYIYGAFLGKRGEDIHIKALIEEFSALQNFWDDSNIRATLWKEIKSINILFQPFPYLQIKLFWGVPRLDTLKDTDFFLINKEQYKIRISPKMKIIFINDIFIDFWEHIDEALLLFLNQLWQTSISLQSIENINQILKTYNIYLLFQKKGKNVLLQWTVEKFDEQLIISKKELILELMESFSSLWLNISATEYSLENENGKVILKESYFLVLMVIIYFDTIWWWTVNDFSKFLDISEEVSFRKFILDIRGLINMKIRSLWYNIELVNNKFYFREILDNNEQKIKKYTIGQWETIEINFSTQSIMYKWTSFNPSKYLFSLISRLLKKSDFQESPVLNINIKWHPDSEMNEINTEIQQVWLPFVYTAQKTFIVQIKKKFL